MHTIKNIIYDENFNKAMKALLLKLKADYPKGVAEMIEKQYICFLNAVNNAVSAGDGHYGQPARRLAAEEAQDLANMLQIALSKTELSTIYPPK